MEHQIKAGDILVTMQYSNNGKKLSECILNILKQKMQGNS